ncbi:MAG: hypothetical protein LBH00_12815, partial [Planctomycetaceae bacterium]|nr:hypothetical protein [Planctomycetaceae bacterium]
DTETKSAAVADKKWAVLKLKEMGLGGGSTIKDDETGTPYASPHWVRNPNVANYPLPYLYSAWGFGEQLTLVSAIWEIKEAGDIDPITAETAISVTAACKDKNGTDIVFSIANGAVQNSTISVAAKIEANTAFSYLIRYFNPLDLTLQMRFTAGNQDVRYEDAGSTMNPVYVCLGNPNDAELKDNLFRTLVHTACAFDNPPAVSPVDSIWAKFETRTMVGWNHAAQEKKFSRPLYYYEPGTNFSQNPLNNLAEFFQQGRGRCGMWAAFLQKACALQKEKLVMVEIKSKVKAPDTSTPGLVIKKWEFLQNAIPGIWNLDYPVQNPPAPDMVDPNDPNRDLYGEMKSITGLPGQNSVPKSKTGSPSEKTFLNHAVVKYISGGGTRTEYLDPSYGERWADEDHFQAKALDGLTIMAFQFPAGFIRHVVTKAPDHAIEFKDIISENTYPPVVRQNTLSSTDRLEEHMRQIIRHVREFEAENPIGERYLDREVYPTILRPMQNLNGLLNAMNTWHYWHLEQFTAAGDENKPFRDQQYKKISESVRAVAKSIVTDEELQMIHWKRTSNGEKTKNAAVEGGQPREPADADGDRSSVADIIEERLRVRRAEADATWRRIGSGIAAPVYLPTITTPEGKEIVLPNGSKKKPVESVKPAQPREPSEFGIDFHLNAVEPMKYTARREAKWKKIETISVLNLSGQTEECDAYTAMYKVYEREKPDNVLRTDEWLLVRNKRTRAFWIGKRWKYETVSTPNSARFIENNGEIFKIFLASDVEPLRAALHLSKSKVLKKDAPLLAQYTLDDEKHLQDTAAEIDQQVIAKISYENESIFNRRDFENVLPLHEVFGRQVLLMSGSAIGIEKISAEDGYLRLDMTNPVNPKYPHRKAEISIWLDLRWKKKVFNIFDGKEAALQYVRFYLNPVKTEDLTSPKAYK